MSSTSVQLMPLDNSGYMLESSRVYLDRKIDRYTLQDSDTPDAVNRATEAIVKLIERNPEIIFVSKPMPTTTLQQIVQTHKYLIINNNNILCLSDKPRAEIDPDYKDCYFSEAIIDEPVKCLTKGHVFEKANIERWIALKGDVCPVGKYHKIGPVEVDTTLQEKIRIFQAKQQEEISNRKEMADQINDHNEIIRGQQRNIDALQKGLTIPLNRTPEMIVGTAKAGTKALALAEKVVFKEIIKEIPYISVVFGLILAGRRFYNGIRTVDYKEFIKATLEIASGIAACFPGGGTIVSLAIDGSLLSHDVYTAYTNKIAFKMNHEAACALFEIEPKERITKECVDTAFRSMSQIMHPDRLKHTGQYSEQKATEAQQLIQEAKDFLYKENHFV